jgi:hypothetical protein
MKIVFNLPPEPIRDAYDAQLFDAGAENKAIQLFKECKGDVWAATKQAELTIKDKDPLFCQEVVHVLCYYRSTM